MLDALIAAYTWAVDLLRNPGEIIVWGGYPGLGLVIFLETGALVFLLPGDSLLVTAGLYAAKGDLDILWLNALLIPLAILGDATSYTLGKRSGPRLFTRSESRVFKPAYLRAAQAFYEKHGGKAIILARFMPIVRTFVPVVAGAARMRYRRFALYNVVGAAAWIVSMTLTGFLLGNVVPGIERHIEKLIVAIVCVSVAPGIWEWLKARRARRAIATLASSPAERSVPRA